jgi:hypothetical protein
MTINESITQNIDIQEFKNKFYNKHGVALHIVTEKQAACKISLAVLEKCIIKTLHINEPRFKHIKSLTDKSRKREYLVYTQIMAHISYKEGYSKSVISRYIKRNPATIIWSIKVVENDLSIKNILMYNAYNNITKEIKNYVGNIPENTEEQINTKPGIPIIWNEAEDCCTK